LIRSRLHEKPVAADIGDYPTAYFHGYIKGATQVSQDEQGLWKAIIMFDV
jgi:hypothetical protein